MYRLHPRKGSKNRALSFKSWTDGTLLVLSGCFACGGVRSQQGSAREDYDTII